MHTQCMMTPSDKIGAMSSASSLGGDIRMGDKVLWGTEVAKDQG